MIKAGFSRLCIDPPLCTPLSGYYEARYNRGVLDSLYVSAAAFSDGENQAVIITLDLCMLTTAQSDSYREAAAKTCGIPKESVFLTCTHTHTGPMIGKDFASELHGSETYEAYLGTRICDAALYAFADLRGASFQSASSSVENISFIRRFRMKDGSVQTNPGIDNENIASPLGAPDNTLNLLKILRSDAEDIYIVNFGTHPDTIGGEMVSADYPGFVRSTVEGALENVKCIFLTAPQGDVNHINPFPKDSDRQGLCYDSFDGVPRGYEHAKHMGRAIGGEVLKICGKALPLECNTLNFAEKRVSVFVNKENDRIKDAEKTLHLHELGRDSELPFKKMELTTEVARAKRIIDLKDAPDTIEVSISCIILGGAAFIGFPGEPFVEIGRKIRKGSPFKTNILCCLTNGGDYYFPTASAYDEGGYEAATSHLKRGTAEKLAEESVKLITELN